MKKILTMMVLVNVFSIISATNIPLIKIKEKILFTLIKTGDINERYTIDNLPSKIIIDKRNNNEIKQGLDGIFYIPRFSAHGCAHYLLVDNEIVQVINMRKSFVDNLKLLMDFFEQKASYTKEDIMFYIRDFIITHNTNQKRINSEGIYID